MSQSHQDPITLQQIEDLIHVHIKDVIWDKSTSLLWFFGVFFISVYFSHLHSAPKAELCRKESLCVCVNEIEMFPFGICFPKKKIRSWRKELLLPSHLTLKTVPVRMWDWREEEK